MNQQSQLNIKVFGESMQIDEPPALTNNVPRHHLEKFDLRKAHLELHRDTPFIAAIAKTDPTLINSSNLIKSIQKLDSTPVVICHDAINPGLKNAFFKEGISFATEDGNAYLPFLNLQQSPSIIKQKPAPLSPQAQRIILNLIAGRWNNCTATDLARLTHRSKSSITKYLKEIEAINPKLVQTSWKTRTLINPWYTKEELFEEFEPFLKSPVRETIRFATLPKAEELAVYEAKLSALSALPFFSDLAYDNSQITVMLEEKWLAQFKSSLGKTLKEAAWNELASFVVEIWAYPLDNFSSVSTSATGLTCVDPYSLYAELTNQEYDDIRVNDAINQLGEFLCQ